MEDFSPEQLQTLAKKVLKGFAVGKLTNNAMGISHAENQAIRRRMEKDNYQGTIPFYICALCTDYLEGYIKEMDNINNAMLLAVSKEEENADIPEIKEWEDVEESGSKKIRSLGSAYKEKVAVVEILKSIPHNIYFCSIIGSMQRIAENDVVDEDILSLPFSFITRWIRNLNNTRYVVDRRVEYMLKKSSDSNS